VSVTYLLRHGRTRLSAAHIANGDPSTAVPLDHVGTVQCRRVARSPWTTSIESCVVSQFTRTRQTAELILGEPAPPMLVEPAFNEIKYGYFEGTPWMIYGRWLRQAGPAAQPPGGGESRREAVRRLLGGLACCLSAPGPRLVVDHGLMISVVLQLLHGEPIDAWDLPEAPYARPIPIDDFRLRRIVRDELGRIAAAPDALAAQDQHRTGLT